MITKFLELVCRKFTLAAYSQEQKGLEKYGQALDPMDKKHDWLNMAEEELVDCYKYLVAERERRNQILDDVIRSLDSASDHMSNYGLTIQLQQSIQQLKTLRRN